MKIVVFGKKSCQKCAILKTRLAKILEEGVYKNFEIISYDLTDEESIVRFCDLECLNFSRIPAFYIEDKGKALQPKEFNTYSLPIILGLQTDYERGGTMTPDMLKQVLDEALNQAGVANDRLETDHGNRGD